MTPQVMEIMRHDHKIQYINHIVLWKFWISIKRQKMQTNNKFIQKLIFTEIIAC